MFRKISRALLLCAVLGSFLLPGAVWAVGLGITPARLDFEAAAGSPEVRSLHVINNCAEKSSFRIYADETYADWLQIAPDEFTLEPELNREVQITATPPRNSEGEHRFLVYVVSVPESSSFDIGAGIKVPVQLHVGDNVAGRVAGRRDADRAPYLIPLLIAEIVLAALCVGLIIRRRRTTGR